MGISAGKPVAVADGHKTTTFLPMKKVPGAPLDKELLKSKNHPSYIPSRTLINHANQAVIEANKNGISHNNAHVGNVMVTQGQGKLVSYGYD